MLKTIIVHVDHSARMDARLRAAALLANEHGAHLVGRAATGLRESGLLVGDAFGHSRYREIVLGGVTRALLERAAIPVLPAHWVRP